MSVSNQENNARGVGLMNQGYYLTIRQQTQLSDRLKNSLEKEHWSRNLFIQHSTEFSAASVFPIYLLSWRAGTRAYSLARYGRARLVTILCGVIFPVNGVICHNIYCTEKLFEPFRPESAWYFALRYAAVHQIAMFMSILGSVGMTFVFARGTGIMVVPDGIFKGGKQSYLRSQILGRLKPYARGLFIASACSTAFMALAGAASYYQTKMGLAKMGRQSLVYREDLSSTM